MVKAKDTNSNSKELTADEVKHRLKKYGWCRGICHFWKQDKPILRVKTPDEDYVYELRLSCHCGSKRVTRLLPSGDLAGDHHTYKYPNDFSTPGHNVRRAVVRKLIFLDTFKK